MKSYTKKILSVTAAFLIAAQQISFVAPVTAEDLPSEAEFYAEEIGLELDSAEAEDALSDLIDINDSDLFIETNDDSTVTQIGGILSEETVESSNDAKDIIGSVSELLGIDNINREIRLDSVSESEYNNIYTFKQYYMGLEMVNSYITIVVDKETNEADYLNSSYVADFSINTVPEITAQQAIDAVEAKHGQFNCSDSKLVIYSEDNETFKLAWEIATDYIGIETLYVDAVTSELLNDNQFNADNPVKNYTIKSNRILLNSSSKILPNNVNSFNIDISTENNKYLLHDIGRKIYVVSDKSFVHGTSFNAADTTKTVVFSHPLNPSYLEDLSTAVLYNVERTYDFYKNKLSYIGFDGKGSYGEDMYVVADLKEGDNNAYSWGKCIGFGEGNGKNIGYYGSDIDIVAHEYTHCVTNSKLHWSGSSRTEAAALGEAYSDIMGEYVDTTREWQHGTDQYVLNTNKNTSERKKISGRDMFERVNYNKADYERGIDGHVGAWTINHVAYWMDHLGVDADTAARIWFVSLDFLPQGQNNATFSDCRRAMINATKRVVNNYSKQEEILTKIKVAFNRVHIEDPSEKTGDVNRDGRVDMTDVTALSLKLSDKDNLTSYQKATADVNFDGSVDLADLATLRQYVNKRITEF